MMLADDTDPSEDRFFDCHFLSEYKIREALDKSSRVCHMMQNVSSVEGRRFAETAHEGFMKCARLTKSLPTRPVEAELSMLDVLPEEEYALYPDLLPRERTKETVGKYPNSWGALCRVWCQLCSTIHDMCNAY